MATWWNSKHAGREAGRIDQNTGYRRISIDGTDYQSHRIAFFMGTGTEPPAELDHANRIRADNRLANLRPATRAQNGANGSGGKRTVAHGLPRGVSWQKERGKYRSQVRRNGRNCTLGRFDLPLAAGIVAAFARSVLHQDFAVLPMSEVCAAVEDHDAHAEAISWAVRYADARVPGWVEHMLREMDIRPARGA